jgi:hypothetical protein
MGMNRPSVEASDLTTAGKFVPHATSPEKKRQERGVGRGSDATEIARGEKSEELWKNIQSD